MELGQVSVDSTVRARAASASRQDAARPNDQAISQIASSRTQIDSIEPNRIAVRLLDSSTGAPLASRQVSVKYGEETTHIQSDINGLLLLQVGVVELSPINRAWFDTREVEVAATTGELAIALDCYGWITPRFVDAGGASSRAVKVWVVASSALTDNQISGWSRGVTPEFPVASLKDSESLTLDVAGRKRAPAGSDYLVACYSDWPVFVDPAHSAWRGHEVLRTDERFSFDIGAGSARGCPLSAPIHIKPDEDNEVLIRVTPRSSISLRVDCQGMRGDVSVTLHRLSPRGPTSIVNSWNVIEQWTGPNSGVYGSLLQATNCPVGLYRFTGTFPSETGSTVMFKFFELTEAGVEISMTDCIGTNSLSIAIDPSLGLPDGTRIGWTLTAEHGPSERQKHNGRSVYFGSGVSPLIHIDGISTMSGNVVLDQLDGPEGTGLIPWDLTLSPAVSWTR